MATIELKLRGETLTMTGPFEVTFQREEVLVPALNGGEIPTFPEVVTVTGNGATARGIPAEFEIGGKRPMNQGQFMAAFVQLFNQGGNE